MCQCLQSVFYARHDDINARINNIKAQQKTLEKTCFNPEETYDTKSIQIHAKTSRQNRHIKKQKTKKEESKYMKT